MDYFSGISSDDEEFLNATQLLETEVSSFPDSELSRQDIDFITPFLSNDACQQ